MSKNCGEYDLDDLLAITAIPVANYSPGTHSWQLKPNIPAADFSPSLAGAIVIGNQRPKDSAGNIADIKGIIPIEKSSGKAKDTEAENTPGRLHTVSVSCEADERDPSVRDYLLALERTPSHLLLSFRNGARGFAIATDDTYTCEVERDGSKTSVSFKIYNLMGIQLIVG